MNHATKSKTIADFVSVVYEQDRPAFLPTHFPGYPVLIERTLYHIAKKTIPTLSPGTWEYAYSQSGVPFVFRPQIEDCPVTTMFGYGLEQLAPELAGLLATATTLLYLVENHEAFGIDEDTAKHYLNLYNRLLEDGREIARATGYASAFHSLTD